MCGCRECGFEYMGGTRGLGFVSTAVDVLEMSVVRGAAGVCGVCEMCGFGLYQSCRNRASVFGLRCWLGPGSWEGGVVLCLRVL